MNAIFILSFVFFFFIDYAESLEITHLVTMRKSEFMEIIECVSKSLNPVLCEKFVECEQLMPKQIMMATHKCKKECMVGGVKKCNHHEPIFESPEIPYKIFDCVLENTHKLNAEESRKMVEFEKCIRDLHHMSCKFPKHLEEYF